MKNKSESKKCQNCQESFIIEADDFLFYEKMKVTPPTWCSYCRFIRKMTFVNERSLYRRNCANCDKSMVTMYNPETPLPVWCIKCHTSDAWDGCDYARNYDFSRPSFEQFKELKYLVPHKALDQNEKNGEGCEYANFCYSSKNAYLSFNITGNSENIKYSKCYLRNNKNCMDSLIIKDCERGYELVRSSKNYNSSFLIESDQCVESHFLYDCSNCVNCCLSSNLKNKSNYFRNEQLKKEDYKKAIESLQLGTYSGQMRAKKEFEEMKLKSIHKYAYIKNSVNAVGDFIENSKNIYHCYGVVDAENMKSIYFAVNTTKDSQDIIFIGRVEECYEFTLGGRGGSRIALSFSCGGGCKDLMYCDNCRSCSYCFGCSGLIKKEYCIFNKQFTKEEYFPMVDKIKKHMDEMPYVDKNGRRYGFGEYFPTDLSPFAYNETVAFEENPLSKEEVLAQGYRWKEMEAKLHKPTTGVDKIPDDIKDVSDSICDETIECPNLGKIETQCVSAYKILPDELAFYRQMNLPIPRYCPNCRYHKRMVWKNPFRFYKRQCMCELLGHDHSSRCTEEFETMYSPDRPEKIYCDKCYKKEIY